MTRAEEISKRFNDDGHCWENRWHEHVDEVARDECVACINSVSHTATKYVFEDRSTLVLTNAGWDIGYDDDPAAPCECFCWPEIARRESMDGHNCECPLHGGCALCERKEIEQ